MRFNFGYFLISTTFFVLLGCAKEEKNDNQNLFLAGLIFSEQERISSLECTTNIDNQKTFDINSPLELCKPKSGFARHFRFEDVGTTANNAYLNLLVGYGDRNNANEFPVTSGMGGSSATTTNGDGRWRIFFGKSSSCDKAFVDVRFSGLNTGFAGGNGVLQEILTTQSLTSGGQTTGCSTNNSGIWGPSTICMDITKGKEGVSPKVRIWVTGKNGADCKNLSTLSANNTVFSKSDWSSQVPTKDAKNYIYRNLDGITLKKVVVRSESVLGE